ncbi:CoA transferase [Gammaproteobacteria bacterium]|nr:CoA transferase [Gammaproteobacteria bacterium]
MQRPLQGLKILDFTHVLAGPYATRILGDMGADVVKINSIDRAVGANDPTHPYYLMWNRNKRALAIDLSNESARKTCKALCEKADIVIDNFSVGVLDRWGIGYDDVSPTNKKVIYVQMSGMGEGGPWSKFVTYAPTIHALCGLTATTGVEGRQDIGIGFSYNDHQAGLHGAVAILAGLESLRHTGQGQKIDISQFEVGVNFVAPSLMDYFANKTITKPVSNDLPYDAIAPHGVYPCIASDKSTNGQNWIAIACMNQDQWLLLKTLLGNPEWANREEFSTITQRYENRRKLDEFIANWTHDQEAYELMQTCQGAGVPAGVVQSGADLAEKDPQLKHRKFLFAFDELHKDFGQTFGDKLPIKFDKTPCESYLRSRSLGEDNDEVLGDWLDLAPEEIQKNKSEGWLT